MSHIRASRWFVAISPANDRGCWRIKDTGELLCLPADERVKASELLSDGFSVVFSFDRKPPTMELMRALRAGHGFAAISGLVNWFVARGVPVVWHPGGES